MSAKSAVSRLAGCVLAAGAIFAVAAGAERPPARAESQGVFIQSTAQTRAAARHAEGTACFACEPQRASPATPDSDASKFPGAPRSGARLLAKLAVPDHRRACRRNARLYPLRL